LSVITDLARVLYLTVINWYALLLNLYNGTSGCSMKEKGGAFFLVVLPDVIYDYSAKAD